MARMIQIIFRKYLCIRIKNINNTTITATSTSTISARIKRLLDVVLNGPGLPFFLYAGDYKGCGYNIIGIE